MSHLSLREIAKKSGLPERTVHYYHHCFEDLIPCIEEGDRCKYPLEVVDIFCAIAQGFHKKMTREELIEDLEELCPLPITKRSPLEQPHAERPKKRSCMEREESLGQREWSEGRTRNRDIVFRVRDVLQEKKRRRPWWKRLL